MLKFITKLFSTSSSSRDVVGQVDSSPELKIAINLLEGSESYQARGNAYLADGKFDEAEKCYLQAVTIDPDNAEACINLAYVLKERNLIQHALVYLKRAVVIDPKNGDGLYMLATLSRDTGNLDEATTYFESALKLNPGFQTIYGELGQLLAQAGKIDLAKSVISKGISVFPEVGDFHYFLGTLHAASSANEESIRSFKKAIAIRSDYADAYIALGDLYTVIGRPTDASNSYKAALQFRPDSAEVLVKQGNAQLSLELDQEALVSFGKAMTLKPNLIAALIGQSTAFTNLKRSNEALITYDRIAQLLPDSAGVFLNRSAVLLDLHKYEEALVSCERALYIKPDLVAAIINKGTALKSLNRYEAALATYNHALDITPDSVDAMVNRSAVLSHLKRYGEALESCDRALSLKPGTCEMFLNRGVALKGLNRHEDALASYERANFIRPNDSDVLVNRGNALQRLGRHEEALVSFADAIKIKPRHADAHFKESMSQLQMGDFDLGWQKYEWRWLNEPMSAVKPNYKQPLWLGKEPLQGKTILLHAEQGLGDAIQFCRYAKLVAATGATVLLVIPKALEPLLTSLNGVHQLLIRGEVLPPFDYHCPLLSLPLAFRTTVATVPCDLPYLSASTELVNRLRRELGSDDYFRIGLCWKGGTAYAGDAERSPGIAPFSSLAANFAGTRAKFYTLLPDSREVIRNIGGEDLGYELDQNSAPFEETAALIRNLDLVITCDTSIGHIAGALGKPVWIVLPFSPDWRWIRDQEWSPWYPNTRLFRQNVAGDWVELFRRVSDRLSNVLDGTSKTVWPVTHRTSALFS